MIANKTSFNSQSASDAGKKSGEVRRQNKLIRNAYRHAFADHADAIVSSFVNGSNEMLGAKIPQDMRGRIVEQVVTQTVIAALTTAIKQGSDIDVLLAKCDAKALESMPPESDDGSEYMTPVELMRREGTQSEADSANVQSELSTFGYWYNDLQDDIKSDVMSEYFHSSLNELFEHCDKPAADVIKQFNIKIGV
ncbi:hypothetical protein MM182_18860 [Aeromonas sp. MR19]|uniref:hypothetical protein n=1 Tax=Aeromonas sp. MR19 TaxID=2923421 RepID=UPI001F4A8406|nr:hypothetical protein [Aeromonas sp. MR19]MCH7377416.1 hypothetical protein [Aeromonas sp. MR19]